MVGIADHLLDEVVDDEDDFLADEVEDDEGEEVGKKIRLILTIIFAFFQKMSILKLM